MRTSKFLPLGAAVVAACLLMPVRGFAPDPPPPLPPGIISQIQGAIIGNFDNWLAQGHVVMNPPRFVPQPQGGTNAAQTNIVLTLMGPPGESATIMRSTNLMDWSAAGSVSFDTNYSGTFTEGMSNTVCFYQATDIGIVLVLPPAPTNLPPVPITGGGGGHD